LKADQSDVADWIQGEGFRKATGSDGANAIARLEGRINFVREKLLETNRGSPSEAFEERLIEIDAYWNCLLILESRYKPGFLVLA